MSLMLLTPPATEPLTRAEAKAFAKIDTADDDALVDALIIGARQIVEAMTRLALISQSWRYTTDRPPRDGIVRLPIAPVSAVTAVRQRDRAGVATALDASAWRADLGVTPQRVVLISPPAAATIEVDVTAGHGTAAQVPEALKQALRLIVAHHYEHRGGGDGGPLPAAATAILSAWRLRSLA